MGGEGVSCVLTVWVSPRASRTLVRSEGEQVRVWVTAPPVDGAANAAVEAALAEALGVAQRAVAVVRGQSGRTKQVRVDGLSLDEVRARLTT